MRASWGMAVAVAATLIATAPRVGAQGAGDLVPAEREAKFALGKQNATALDLYAALRKRANGGSPLTPGTP